MTSQNNHEKDWRHELNRTIITKELDFRRDKQWRIFSWTSSFLLATIGGIVVLVSKGEFSFPFLLRLPMICALFVIVLYTSIWINENIERERKLGCDLQKVYKQMELTSKIDEPLLSWQGYIGAVRLLGVAAIAAVLMAPK